MMKRQTIGKSFLVLILFLVNQNSRYWDGHQYADLIRHLESIGFHKSTLDSLFLNPRLEFYPGIYQEFEKAKAQKENPYLKFLTPESVELGRMFLEENETLLQKIEETYGVPKEVLVALLAVESCFGQNMGSYQALGVFNSLIFYGQDKDSLRVAWAKKELVAFLKLCQANNLDPLSVKSSYAGALGIPQFMPTSFVLAIDGNGDGKINVFSENTDALASIAYYLVENGWDEDNLQALFCYNHDKRFVNCIKSYAFLLHKSSSQP